MSGSYRLVVDGKDYTPESGVVVSIATEESRERRAISVLTAELLDPNWSSNGSIFAKTKDPAFDNVPIKLYLSKAGEARTQQQVVFDGKLTTMAVGYPERKTLTLTCHDNSIDARRNKTLKAFGNKTGVQVAEAIAKRYGFEIDTTQIASNLAKLTQRRMDLGYNPKLSDWDHLQRALAADGFVAHVKGKKLHVTQAPSVVYGTVFYRDRFPVVSLNVTIQHVRGPGGQGDVRGAVFMDGRGTQAARRDAEAKREKSTAQTGRMSVAGAATKSGNTQAIEDIDGNKPEAVVEYLRKRKDAAQLTILAAPDLSVINNVQLRDWGGKVDGTWFCETVRHTIAGEGSALTIAGLMRGASQGAKKGAGL